MRNVTVIGLYREGLCSAAVAVNHGAKPKDHREAIRHGVAVESLVAAGVDLQKVQRGEARANGKAIAQTDRAIKAEIAARPKPLVMVRRTTGSVKVVMTGHVKPGGPTPHDVAVAMAVSMANKAAKAKHDREYAAKHGQTVTLSDTDKAAMIARFTGKVYLSDK